MAKKTREEKIADIIFGVYGKEIKEKKLSKLGVAKDEMSKIAKRYRKVAARVLKKHGKEVPKDLGASFEDVSNALNSIDLKPEMRKLYFEMFVDPFGALLSEVSKEITGLYTIVVKDGNTSRRFTFKSHGVDSLRKELSKRYGSKIVSKIVSAIKKAETNGRLKYFAKDDAVDFEIINGDKVKAVFKKEDAITENAKVIKSFLNMTKQEVPGWAKYIVQDEDGEWNFQDDKGDKAKKKWSGYTSKPGNSKGIISVKELKEYVITESLKELKLYLNKEKQEAPEWAKYVIRTKDGRWFWRADKGKDSKKKWTGYEDRNGHQVVTVSVNNLEEANIEIKDKNASRITVDGKPFNGNLGDLKAKYPKHFAALRMQLKKDGKSLANFGGDDPKVDIVAKADGTIAVNYDA